MSNTRELREVGIIVGEASSSEFFFASRAEECPSKWEYLVAFSKEEVDGRWVEVPVIAQVEKIVSASQALSKDVDLDALRRIIAAELEDVRTWGKARVLGYLAEPGDRILQPRRAIAPGKPVYVAPGDILSKFYSFPEEEGLLIGNLITRADVPVYLSIRGFRRHLAIIAQTGAGKSYCAGVLIEELLRKGATVVVLDPHADYVLMSLAQGGGRHELSDRITVFRSPASPGRFRAKDLGRVEAYEVAFSDLDAFEICDVAGIPEKAVNIREAVRRALEVLKGSGSIYSPEDLLRALEDPTWATDEEGKPDRRMRGYAEGAVKYIRSLAKLRVFGSSSTPIERLLKEAHASIVDLSGLEDKAMNYIASRILQGIYDAVAMGAYEYPVFAIIEEAHRFVPPDRETYASPVINKIAAEGRKFGIFLTLITQRPSKVDPDSLSQCNSQIVMRLTNPEDQKAVEESSERMSKDLMADLPGLNPGECIIVGEVTKAPVMAKIRRRETMEGGADVDIVAQLRLARRAAEEAERERIHGARREPFRGEFR
ncbi:MAG: ATP-binding protein [Candidatus Bathyarchaeia archaeon]